MIEQVYLLTTLVLGLFAGSLLTEAAILVPYWRRMEASTFFSLHASLGPKLFHYFAPLTTCTVILTIASAALAGSSNPAWLISAGLCLSTLAIFFIYFRSANQRFAEHSINEQELSLELAKWAKWHWLRTTLAIAALAISIYGHSIDVIR